MKKILALVLAITTVFALAIPAMANNNKNTVTPANDFIFEVNNANFHCNDIEGENGRVWPDLGDSKSNNGNNKDKTTKTFTVDRIAAGSTTWQLRDTVICPSPECERTDWITFSNNSGVPNGNNVQFQHNGPSRRWIIIKVIYNVKILACPEFTCKNAGKTCKFNCEGCPPCPNATINHECGRKCVAVEHAATCPFNKVVTCVYDCKHAKDKIEVKVNKRELIKIADGFNFTHTAPDRWEGGRYTSGPKSINENLKMSKTYEIFYEGKGDCKCKCKPTICKAACKPCKWTPPKHVHIPVCDNCKDGKGGNHENCENCNDNNLNKTTNYFCLNCPDNNNKELKLAKYNPSQGWTIDVITGWDPPTGINSGVCQCSWPGCK